MKMTQRAAALIGIVVVFGAFTVVRSSTPPRSAADQEQLFRLETRERARPTSVLETYVGRSLRALREMIRPVERAEVAIHPRETFHIVDDADPVMPRCTEDGTPSQVSECASR